MTSKTSRRYTRNTPTFESQHGTNYVVLPRTEKPKREDRVAHIFNDGVWKLGKITGKRDQTVAVADGGSGNKRTKYTWKTSDRSGQIDFKLRKNLLRNGLGPVPVEGTNREKLGLLLPNNYQVTF